MSLIKRIRDRLFPYKNSQDKSLSLKVLHICYLKPGSLNGYEVRVVEEAKVLVKEGVEVLIAVFVHPDKFAECATLEVFKDQLEKVTGASVFVYPSLHFFDLDDNAKVTKEIDEPVYGLINQNSISIIHGQALYAAIHARRIARNCGGKSVFDIHGILPEETGMRGGDPERVKQLEHAEKNAIRDVDLRIMVSESMNAYYKAKYNLPDQSYQLIPCCVHSGEYEMTWEERVRIRKEKKINNRFVVLYLGTLSVWQWPEAMFNMFSRLHKQMSDCLFYLLIPESDHEQAMEFIQQYQLPENSFILEEVPHSEVGKIIGIADAGVLLREDHPVNRVSSPTKFGEYLAAGLPVILTDGIGDYSDMVHEFKIGINLKIDGDSFMQDEQEKLLRFLKKVRQNRKEWADRCKQTALETLKWRTYGKKLVSQYRKLLEKQ